MKIRRILPTVFFSLIILLIACETKTKPVEDSNPTSNNVPHDCILHDHREGRIVQGMDPVCARAMIDNYALQTKLLKEENPNFHNIDDLLIRGSRVDIDELRKILLIVDSIVVSPPDSMYIMLAAHNTGRSGVIFAFEHGNTVNPDPYTYFNFTYPCPDMCPWEMQ